MPKRREPEPQGDLKEPPAELTPAQLEEWNYVIAHCPPGMLKKLDRDLLVSWVKTTDRVNQAELEQAGLPLVIDGKISSCLIVIEREMNRLIKLSDRLGFSPVARPRLQVMPEKPTEAAGDTWGKLRRFPVVDGGKR